MYVYFDKQGIIREIIYADKNRLGDNNANSIYAYFEGFDDVNVNVWVVIKRPDDTLTNEEAVELLPETQAIPYDREQDLVYFEEYKKYKFYHYSLSSEIINQDGLYKATFRYQVNTKSALRAQGLLTFNVEDSALKNDDCITQSQYDYLIEYISQSVSNIKGSYVKKVEYNKDTYTITFTFQNDTQLVIDLPDEEQIRDIAKNKENIAQLNATLSSALNNFIFDQETYTGTFTTVGGNVFNLDLSQIVENTQNIGTLQIDLGVVKDKQETYTSDISALKTKVLEINTNKQDIQALERDVSNHEVRLDNIEDDIKTLNSDDVVKVISQNFSESQKAQARKNIGVDTSQFIPISQKGKANGLATLDSSGFLSPSQIPSHLDEVVSGTLVNTTTFNDRNGKKVTPKEYCIYYDIKSKKRYGWSGTEFVELTSGGLVIGNVAGTAFDGGKGTTLENKVDTLEDKVKPIPNKVDKVSGSNKVYTTEGGVSYATGATGNTFAKRLSDGRLKAGRPTEDDDVITKAYMQEFGGKIDPVDLETLIDGQNHISVALTADKSKIIVKNDSSVVLNTHYATKSKAGLVKVGNDFDVASDGTITLYKAIEILSFTNNVGTVAKGQTINNATFTWVTNKTPNSISLDNQAITPVTTTSKSFSNLGLTQTKIYTLKVTDARGKQVSSTTSITFANYVLYGAGASFAENNLIKVLKTSRTGTYEITAENGEYIYFSIPASLGTPTFYVGGFEGGFTLEKTYSWNNGFGYTENFNVYKSNQPNLGKTEVEVR